MYPRLYPVASLVLGIWGYSRKCFMNSLGSKIGSTRHQLFKFILNLGRPILIVLESSGSWNGQPASTNPRPWVWVSLLFADQDSSFTGLYDRQRSPHRNRTDWLFVMDQIFYKCYQSTPPHPRRSLRSKYSDSESLFVKKQDWLPISQTGSCIWRSAAVVSELQWGFPLGTCYSEL